jgi:hypothetical protein
VHAQWLGDVTWFDDVVSVIQTAIDTHRSICSHEAGALMRTATDCTNRAEECRRLAKLAVKAEDFAHFSEMAETWELLAKQRHDKLAETWALAEAIAKGRQRL